MLIFMMVDRAPSRGGYDRALSPHERRTQARARLRASVASVFERRGHECTVEQVVRHAGMGRNSFYQHYDDIQSALDDLSRVHCAAVKRAVSVAVSSRRTPMARLATLTQLWLDLAATHAGASLVALRPATSPGEVSLSPLSTLFAELISTEVFRRPIGAQSSDHLLFVSAAMAGFAREVAGVPQRAPELARIAATAIARIMR